jgi:hypothetical protein
MPAEKCLAWIAELNAAAMAASGDTTITTALRTRAQVPVRQSSGNEPGRVTSIAAKRGRVS